MARFDLPFTLNSITTFLEALEAQPIVELDYVGINEDIPKTEHSQDPVDEEESFCGHREGSESEGEV